MLLSSLQGYCTDVERADDNTIPPCMSYRNCWSHLWRWVDKKDGFKIGSEFMGSNLRFPCYFAPYDDVHICSNQCMHS